MSVEPNIKFETECRAHGTAAIRQQQLVPHHWQPKTKMTRQEHLNWCKQRAMEYVNAGDLRQAFASMCSDTMKHPETEMHRATNEMGMGMLMAGLLDTKAEMTKWIQGYN